MEANTGQDDITENTVEAQVQLHFLAEVRGNGFSQSNCQPDNYSTKKKKKRNTRTVMSLTNHLPLASINSSPGRLNYPPLLDNFEHKLCPSFQLPSTCLEKLIQLRFQPLAEEIVNVLLAAREMAHCACPPPHPPNH